MKQFAIFFAGVPGSSKTTIINHVSPKFGLSVFSNDQLRNEIKEDLLVDDITNPKALEQYNQRVLEEDKKIFESGKSIIFDCSVDRRWSEYKKMLLDNNYEWFLVSLDFSKDFMANLYKATGSMWTSEDLEAYNKQHQDFLTAYSQDVSLHLTDKDFSNRVTICLDEVGKFINA